MELQIDWVGILQSNLNYVIGGVVVVILIIGLIVTRKKGGRKMVDEIEKNAFKERLATLYQQIQDKRQKQAQEEFELIQKLRDKNSKELTALEYEYKYLYEKVK